MIQNATIELTRQEAEEYMTQLVAARAAAVQAIGAIDRKRWSPSEKAMAKVPYIRRIEAFKKLDEKLGAAFHLGGW